MSDLSRAYYLGLSAFATALVIIIGINLVHDTGTYWSIVLGIIFTIQPISFEARTLILAWRQKRRDAKAKQWRGG